MMVSTSILNILLVLPFVFAQSSSPTTSNNSSSTTPPQTVITSFSVSTFVTLDSNRQASTGTTTTNFTTTLAINSTSTANATTSSTAPPSTLPTAPTTLAGGGGTNGAPIPGETGVNGQYGPGDGYIAAAVSLERSVFSVGLGGILVGGVLML